MDENRIEASDILRIVAAHHHSPQDLDEGDLCARVWQFLAWDRREIELSMLDLAEFTVDEGLVGEYAARIRAGETPPPILYDPVNASVVDGIHRANAMARCGHARVAAWVGDEATYQPIADPESEDGHDFVP